jgi:hypothetical protein
MFIQGRIVRSSAIESKLVAKDGRSATLMEFYLPIPVAIGMRYSSKSQSPLFSLTGRADGIRMAKHTYNQQAALGLAL